MAILIESIRFPVFTSYIFISKLVFDIISTFTIVFNIILALILILTPKILVDKYINKNL